MSASGNPGGLTPELVVNTEGEYTDEVVGNALCLVAGGFWPEMKRFWDKM